MALPVNTYTTFDAAGIREDLSDVIYDISPTETPFCSGVSRVRATNTKHEWQTDALAAATSAPQLEGDDATADAAVATTRLFNDTQIYRKVISVSGTQRAVNTAGRADEYDYQIAKRGREMKRDIEFSLVNDQALQAGTGTATARTVAGLETWLSTNKNHLAATSTTPGAGTAIVNGDAITITTTTQLSNAVDTVIQQCWTSGGNPGVLMMSGTVKVGFSKVSGIATQFRDVPAKMQAQIVAGADHYVSNFGNHAVVPNRFQNSDTIHVLDMEYWAIAELRTMSTHPLAKTGDSDKSMLITELTLEARNEAASGKVADIGLILV